MSLVAAVVGASGYAGGALLRLLSGHPALGVGRLFGASSAGSRVGQVHRHLPALADRTIGSIEQGLVDGSLADADVVFLALPHGHSGSVTDQLIDGTGTGPVVVDLGADHRLGDEAAWHQYYGSGTPYAAEWVYGLPELAQGQREAIRNAQLVSNPGCYPTPFVALVRPLVDAGLLDAGALITATSITGYSGGGKSMIAQYEAGGDAKLRSPHPYALGLAHKHLPEMVAHTGLRTAPVFMPIVADFYKGLAVTVPLHLAILRAGTTPARVREALAAHYDGERFVRVMPLSDPETMAGGFFDVQGCNDTNRVDLFVFGSETQVLVMSRLDNLGKGASGAAVQSMNVHLGVDEGLGL